MRALVKVVSDAMCAQASIQIPYKMGIENLTVIPIPLHVKRFRERGFNQACSLARRLFHASTAVVDPFILERTRYTAPQMRLSSKERLRNTRGAFQVRKGCEDMVNQRKFLLFDDILTTGSTVSSAADALKRHGASQVDVLAIARAV